MSSNFIVKTRDKGNPQGKRRIYFTCYPSDAYTCFEKICDDIFKTQDCAIYFTNELSASYGDEFDTALRQMSLFVIPVSKKLLKRRNRTIEKDLPFAVREHIPVLPLMLEPGLEEIFTQKFGEMQFLETYSTDESAISYEEKLKKFLESVLIGNELVERIRSAFAAYIFLSYRKKDRDYANELMGMIHNNPLCRDIAIWYDEFLTPGEDFNDSIMDALKKSDIFALLVTPNLVKEENYVRSIEYPAAKKENKLVFPVEMVPTDASLLKEQFKDIPFCINAENTELFNERLIEVVSDIVKTKLSDDPEHIFLIGLAYLEGIDVERNPEKGIELITRAAESGCVEAMDKLAYFYREGIGVEVDWNRYNEWTQKASNAIESCDFLNSEQDLERRFLHVIDRIKADMKIGRYSAAAEVIDQILNELLITAENEEEAYQVAPLVRMRAECFLKMENIQEAMRLCEIAIHASSRVYGSASRETMASYELKAEIYQECEEFNKAVSVYEALYEIQLKEYGENDSRLWKTQANIAMMYMAMGEFELSYSLISKVYGIQRRFLGEDHPDTIKSMMIIAGYYSAIDDTERAFEWMEKTYESARRAWGDRNPETIKALEELAGVHISLGRYEKALELIEKVYDDYKQVLGEFNQKTIGVIKKWAEVYREKGEYDKALDYNDRLYRYAKSEYGEESLYMADVLAEKSKIYLSMEDYEKSLDVNKKRYEIVRSKLGDDNRITVMVLSDIADDYDLLGNVTMAIENGKQAYEHAKIAEDDESLVPRIMAMKLALLYYDAEDYQNALVILERLLEFQKKNLGVDNELSETTEELYCAVLEKIKESNGLKGKIKKLFGK